MRAVSYINNKMHIHCDAGQNKHTNGTSYASVTDEFGNDLIEDNLELFKDFKTARVSLPGGFRHIIITDCDTKNKMKNNSGELTALVAALRIAINKYKEKCTIYSDSQLLVNYWSQGIIRAKTKAAMDLRKLDLIEECIKLRMLLESYGGKVQWISGNDNKADLGYHK